MNQELTQEYLKSILHYNPDTGVFIWKVNIYSGMNYNICHIKFGDIANSISSHGYIRISINKKRYQAHRLAWLYVYGEFPKDQIDHVNHIKTDNRIANLRCVSSQENNKNSSKRKDNTSGHVGVVWHKHLNKWQAQIKVNQKNIYLGLFEDLSEAIGARKQAEINYNFHNNHGV